MEAENTPKVYNKRIGTFTFGLTMILLGIAFIIQLFIPFELLRYILMLWPIVFISLGIETIIYRYKKDIKIKYDIAGTILLFLLLTLGGIFSIANYGINNVLFNPKYQNAIIDSKSSIANSYQLSISNICEIINLTDKPVNVTIIKDTSNLNIDEGDENDEDITDKATAYVNMKYSFDDKESKLLAVLSSNAYNYIITNNDHSKLTIADLPTYISDVNIVIYADKPENIAGTNCKITNM